MKFAITILAIAAIVYFVWLFYRHVVKPTCREFWLCEQESKRCREEIHKTRAFLADHDQWMRQRGYRK